MFFCSHQHFVQRFELFTVCRTLWNAHVQGGHGHDFALAVEHVDLAREFSRWVEQDVGRVDVTAIGAGVDGKGR